MKTLTENRVAKIEGFFRNPEYDFSDDGNRFIGWEYKGLPLTQHRDAEYGTYLSFRVDYLNENTRLPVYFTWQEGHDSEWYELCDKYNGVDELPEIEEIVKDLETVIAGIKALNEKVQNEGIDVNPIVEKLYKESDFADEIILNFKDKFDVFNPCYTDYDVRNARDYLKTLARESKECEEKVIAIQCNKLSRRELKELSERTNKSYIFVDTKDNFYAKQLQELLDRAK